MCAVGGGHVARRRQTLAHVAPSTGVVTEIDEYSDEPCFFGVVPEWDGSSGCGADEDVLHEITSQLWISCHSPRQPVQPWDVRLEESPQPVVIVRREYGGIAFDDRALHTCHTALWIEPPQAAGVTGVPLPTGVQ